LSAVGSAGVLPGADLTGAKPERAASGVVYRNDVSSSALSTSSTLLVTSLLF
jgi:hypothetical protein